MDEEHLEQRLMAALAADGAMTDAELAEHLDAGNAALLPRIAEHTAHLARRGMLEPAGGARWRLSAAWSPLEMARPKPPQPPEFHPS